MSEASSPFVPQTVPVASYPSYIQPDMNYALRVWWAYYWPTNVISAIFTVLLKYEIQHIYQNTAFPAKILLPIMTIGPYVFTYTVAIFVMRYLLGKTFRHFRLALCVADRCAETLPVTFGRAIRVWWTYSWRTLIFSLVCYFVVSMPVGLFIGLFNPRPAVSVAFFTCLGLITNCAVSLYVVYTNVLDEEFSDFRVTLLPRVPQVEAPPFS